MYKQTFLDSTDSTDSDLLLTSIVPLRMIARTDSSEKIMWLNPRSSSTRFCMPIRFQFIKERQDIIIHESEYIESQISSLLPTSVKIDGKNISIRHILMKIMLDGKIANALELIYTKLLYLQSYTKRYQRHRFCHKKAL